MLPLSTALPWPFTVLANFCSCRFQQGTLLYSLSRRKSVLSSCWSTAPYVYDIRYKILCIFPFSTLRTYYSIFFRVCQDGIFKNQKKIFWSNLLPFSKNGIFVRAVAQTALNFHSYAFNFFRLVKFQVLTTFLRLWERPSANPSVYRNLILFNNKPLNKWRLLYFV